MIRAQRRREILFFIFSSLLSGVLLNVILDIAESPSIGMEYLPETIGDLPVQIVTDALANGGIAVHLFGTSKEKHDFAKGRSTRFGQMPYAADSRLSGMGWSESKIHRVGFQHGYSELWDPSRKQ